MCLGEVLVLAHENDYGVPEVFDLVLFQAVADYFSLPNVGQGVSSLGV
jgi:hypothetical protein